FYRVGSARPGRARHRRPRGGGRRLALGIPWLAAARGPGGRGFWGGPCAAGVLVVLALRRVPLPASPGTATVPYLAVLGVTAGAGTALASLSSGVLPVAAAGGIAGGVLLPVSMR